MNAITFRQYRRFTVGNSHRYQFNKRLVRKKDIPAYIHTIFGALESSQSKEQS